MSAMLERPELDYVAGVLKEELSGTSIRHVEVRRSIVLRCFVEGTPDQVMGGHTFGNVRRRGHFLIFELLGPHEIELVAAPMQNGFFSLVEVGTAQPRDLSVVFVLADGREISAPVEWFPRLRDATPAQRQHWRLIGKGIGVHWPDIDEDLSTQGLLQGSPAPKSAARAL